LKSSPKFSILLPVFNGEKFLKASINSVLSQSLKSFELLICDDASTDGSWAIIREYKDLRIQAFRNQKNRGLFPNLNFLLTKAKAPLIRIWSQDDVMKVNALKTEHKFWITHPQIAISHCGVDQIDENGNCVGNYKVDTTPEIVSPSMYAQISGYWGNLSPNICNVTVSRKAFLEHGNFNERLRQAGDFDMWARICRFENLGMIKQSLVQMRVHTAQFSRWPTSGADWAIESHKIMHDLLPWVPESVRGQVAHQIRYKTHILYFHNALKSLCLGYFKQGLRTLLFLRRQESLFEIFMRWLWTNGARNHMPASVYDKEKAEVPPVKKVGTKRARR